MKESIDIELLTANLLCWEQDWFSANGNETTKAIVGISGGKDSSVVAASLVKAIGKDRVIGVMMPNGEQKDISDSIKVCELLGIKNVTIDISKGYLPLSEEITAKLGIEPTPASTTNSPARARMLTLYDIAGRIGNCRVANTCNLSEDVLGYSTFYGDSAGDFAPLRYLTTEEVVALGDNLGLPRDLTHKTPSDGMCGKSDEDNLGFTYKEVNELVRKGVAGPNYEKILQKYKATCYKTKIINIPGYDPYLPNFLEPKLVRVDVADMDAETAIKVITNLRTVYSAAGVATKALYGER